MAPVIEVHQLTHHFGAVRALDGASFSVEEGEVFGVLGPNGAGKTTLVRLLNGILAPTSGTLRVLGLDPARQGSELRRSTGVLTETPSLYERLTARENLETFGALYGVDPGRLPGRAVELLEAFELSARADDRTGGFSKGMKQRLALARALFHDPRLLFLDEPTSGLDPEAAQGVTRLIEELSRQHGRTVFLCTHNLDEAQRLCDRIAVLKEGRLLAVGTLSELAGNLWQGVWVEVLLESPLTPAAAQQLEALPGVQAVQADGASLEIQVSAHGVVPDLIAGLVGAGARLLQVQPRRYSLEEIYFELQRQQKVSDAA